MEVLRGEEILAKIKDVVSRAKKSVKIASAWIRGEVLRDILSQLPEHVEVQIVVRASSTEDLDITDPEVFVVVKEKGGKVFLNPRLHAKFLISDGREAVVGSANLTRAGLFPEGNVETALYLKDARKVRELEKLFEDIKKQSCDFSKVVAFVVRAETAREGEVVLVRDVGEQTYVKIPTGEGNFLLGRLFSVKSVNTALDKEDTTETLEKIFLEKDEDWRVAALFSRIQEGVEVKTAELEILGEYERERNLFKAPVRSLKAGSPVEVLEAEEDLRAILLKNHSGYDMKFPVYLGKLRGTEVKAYLDMDKVLSMHMAVIGATGSGKTTFVKKVLRNFREPAKVFVFDIYGEYYEDLKETGRVERVPIPNVLLPVEVEDLRKLFKEGGLSIAERSSEEKEFMSFLRRHLKPDLGRTYLGEKSLETLIKEASLRVRDRYLKDSILETLEFWKETFGKESVRDQPGAIGLLRKSIRSESRIVVYDLRDVDITETRVNVAGLVMREILKLAKSDPQDRLIVLEEAHNFAPERGTSDVQMGRENLAYLSARRIAMEGRKLRLGLVAITQRPANISKFILSQLNTQVIFKLITKNDLEAVSIFFERSKEDIFDLLPFLKPGTAYISGLAVPFSFLFQMEEIPYW